MNRTKTLLMTFAMSINFLFTQENGEGDFSFPISEGPYMGQDPPGMVAEPFAPGIISTDGLVVEGVFAPGMKEFYFTNSGRSPFNSTVISFREENRTWRQYKFNATGNDTLHSKDKYIERTDSGWSAIKSLWGQFEPISINLTTKGGLLDGSCGNDEWDVATKIEMPGEAAIHVMHDKDYFYFCASGKAEDYTVLDLYIENTATSKLHKFHLSAQMGESILTDNEWKPASGKWKLKDYAGFWVPYSGLEDIENRKGPIFEKGTHRQMQISRKKFPGNTWNMMIGLGAVSHEGEGPLLYPENAVDDDKSTWMKFSFSN